MASRTCNIALAALLALAACNQDGGANGGDTSNGGDTVPWGFDTVAPDTTGPGEDIADPGDLPPVGDILIPQDIGPDGHPTDTTPPEDTPPAKDTPPPEDIPEDTGPAGQYEPCTEDEDCEDVLCGWHFGDLLCLPEVVGICDEGFTSKMVPLEPGSPDLVLFCVSRYSHLCLPCWSNDDCQDDLTANHACVKLGSIGGFCATISEVPGADPVCPEDYIVSNTLKLVGEDPAGPHGGIVSGCVPPLGICPCTETASALGLNTFCFSGSDEEGWCMGERVCTTDGLAACSVSPPSNEVCDGVDNDCDGEIDEGLCDDEDPCTSDSCSGETGCVFAPLTGTPCDDQDACTDADTCQAGSCVGDMISLEDGNPCTEMTCDPIQGMTVKFLSGACDDGDICTTEDQCVLGDCVGGFDPPGPPPEDPCMGWTCDGIGGWFIAPLPEGTCDDGNTCTTDSCQTGVGCAYAPVPNCCGNGSTDAGEECDDGNQESGDGCDASCVEEEMANGFVGYTTFNHNVCEQTFGETDVIMDQACENAYGAGTQAASIPDLFAGITGLADNNNSGDWVMFKCPLCEGSTSYWTCDGQQTSCRKGVNNSDPWPTTEDSGWNMNMCGAQRTAVCVQ